MGITIALENEQGEIIDRVIDPGNILHRLLPSADDPQYNLVRSIDWYGDTTFNRLQIEPFLSEWKEIAVKANSTEEQELFSRVSELAVRCQREVHLYLKFYGD